MKVVAMNDLNYTLKYSLLKINMLVIIKLITEKTKTLQYLETFNVREGASNTLSRPPVGTHIFSPAVYFAFDIRDFRPGIWKCVRYLRL
jgi:hypothetical protein